MSVRHAYRAGVFALVTIALSSCGRAPQYTPGKSPEENIGTQSTIVFAAASMKPALDAMLPEMEKALGAKVNVSYASSAVLAQQVQSGAPADVLISADPGWAAKLDESGKATKHADFLGNSLVLIVPARAGDTVQGPEDLAKDGVKYIAIGDPASVPAGVYAKEALTSLGLFEKLKPKFVPGQDVRQALMYVERGEVDAGIVYATDARSSKSVRVVAALDASLKKPVRYSLVLVQRDALSPKAVSCYEYLRSDAAMRTFEAAGFQRLPNATPPPVPAK